MIAKLGKLYWQLTYITASSRQMRLRKERMSLVRLSPFFGTLNRWPNVWDEDEMKINPVHDSNLELFETNTQVVVKANVAGLKENQIDVTFEKGVLWIKAENEAEESNDDKTYYSKSSWSYSYKVAVPGTLDLTKEPTAEVENGVITITFQKAEISRPKKLTVSHK